MIINSGDHKFNSAVVNDNGELKTLATGVSKLYVEGEKGNSFFHATDFLAITTLNVEHGILYIKNTSEYTLHINQIRTCGTQVQQWKMYKNVTTGTLVSAGVSLEPQNLFFGSGKVFSGSNLVGGDGFTVTNGTFLTQWINNAGHSTLSLDGALSLTTGTSLILTCEVSVAATMCANILAYYDTSE